MLREITQGYDRVSGLQFFTSVRVLNTAQKLVLASLRGIPNCMSAKTWLHDRNHSMSHRVCPEKTDLPPPPWNSNVDHT